MFSNVSKATAVALPDQTVGYVDLDVTNQPDDPRGGPQKAWFRVPLRSGSSIFPIAFNRFDLNLYLTLSTYGDPGTGYDSVGNISDNPKQEALLTTLATTRHLDGVDQRDAPFGPDAPAIDAPHFNDPERWWQAAWVWPGVVTEAMYLTVTPTADFLARGGSTRIYFDTSPGQYGRFADAETASYTWFQWEFRYGLEREDTPAWAFGGQEWPIEPGATAMSFNWYREGVRGPGAVRTFTPNYTGAFEVRTPNFYAAQYRLYDAVELHKLLLFEDHGEYELQATQSGPFSDGTHLIAWNVVKGRAYLLHLTASSDARTVQHLLDGAPPYTPPWIADEGDALAMTLTHTEVSAASGSLARPYALTADGIVRNP